MEGHLVSDYGRRQFFLEQLLPVQGGVQTVALDEAIVGASLGNSPLVQHEDLIRVADRRNPVRHDDRGPLAHDVAQTGEDFFLCVGVDGRQRVVQNEDARIDDDRAGDGRPLLLAARQRDAALADHRVVSLGEVGDILVEPSHGRRVFDAPPPLLFRLIASPVLPARCPLLPFLPPACPSRPSCPPCPSRHSAAPGTLRASKPNATLAAKVSEKRNGSCGTNPMAPRRTASGSSLTSTPSRNTVPGGGSCRRASRLINVDLPEPVGPTSATVCPASILAETWLRTGVPS